MVGPWGKPRIIDPASTNLVCRSTGLSAYVTRSVSPDSSTSIKYRPGDWKNASPRPLLQNTLTRCASVSQLSSPQPYLQRSSSTQRFSTPPPLQRSGSVSLIRSPLARAPSTGPGRDSSPAGVRSPSGKRAPSPRLSRSPSGSGIPVLLSRSNSTTCMGVRPGLSRSNSTTMRPPGLSRSGSTVSVARGGSPGRSPSLPVTRSDSDKGRSPNTNSGRLPLARSDSTNSIRGRQPHLTNGRPALSRSGSAANVNIRGRPGSPLSRSMSNASVAKKNLQRPNISSEILRKAKLEKKRQEEGENYLKREEERRGGREEERRGGREEERREGREEERRVGREEESRVGREEESRVGRDEERRVGREEDRRNTSSSRKELVRSPYNQPMSIRSVTSRISTSNTRLVRDKSGRLVRDEDSGGDVSSSSGSFGLPRDFEERNKAERAKLLRLKMAKRVAGVRERKERNEARLRSLDRSSSASSRLLEKPRPSLKKTGTEVGPSPPSGISDHTALNASKMFSDGDSDDVTESDSDYSDTVMRPDHNKSSTRPEPYNSPNLRLQRQFPTSPKHQYKLHGPRAARNIRQLNPYHKLLCTLDHPIKFPTTRPMACTERDKLDKIQQIAFQLDRPLTAAELYAIYKDPVMKPVRRSKISWQDNKENRTRVRLPSERLRASRATSINSDSDSSSAKQRLTPSYEYDTMTGRRLALKPIKGIIKCTRERVVSDNSTSNDITDMPTEEVAPRVKRFSDSASPLESSNDSCDKLTTAPDQLDSGFETPEQMISLRIVPENLPEASTNAPEVSEKIPQMTIEQEVGLQLELALQSDVFQDVFRLTPTEVLERFDEHEKLISESEFDVSWLSFSRSESKGTSNITKSVETPAQEELLKDEEPVFMGEEDITLESSDVNAVVETKEIVDNRNEVVEEAVDAGVETVVENIFEDKEEAFKVVGEVYDDGDIGLGDVGLGNEADVEELASEVVTNAISKVVKEIKEAFINANYDDPLISIEYCEDVEELTDDACIISKFEEQVLFNEAKYLQDADDDYSVKDELFDAESIIRASKVEYEVEDIEHTGNQRRSNDDLKEEISGKNTVEEVVKEVIEYALAVGNEEDREEDFKEPTNDEDDVFMIVKDRADREYQGEALDRSEHATKNIVEEVLVTKKVTEEVDGGKVSEENKFSERILYNQDAILEFKDTFKDHLPDVVKDVEDKDFLYKMDDVSVSLCSEQDEASVYSEQSVDVISEGQSFERRSHSVLSIQEERGGGMIVEMSCVHSDEKEYEEVELRKDKRLEDQDDSVNVLSVSDDVSYEQEEIERDRSVSVLSEDVSYVSEGDVDSEIAFYDQYEDEYLSQEDNSGHQYQTRPRQDGHSGHQSRSDNRDEFAVATARETYSDQYSEYTESLSEEAEPVRSSTRLGDPRTSSPFGNLTINPIRSTLSESTRLLLEKRRQQQSKESDMSTLNQTINSILNNNTQLSTHISNEIYNVPVSPARNSQSLYNVPVRNSRGTYNVAETPVSPVSARPSMDLRPSFAALLNRSRSSTPVDSDVDDPPVGFRPRSENRTQVSENQLRSRYLSGPPVYNNKDNTAKLASKRTARARYEEQPELSRTRIKKRSGIAFSVDLDGNSGDAYC